MKRKRSPDEPSKVIEGQPRQKKQRLYEKYNKEVEFVLPDDKTAVCQLRTNHNRDAWVISMSNPYFPGSNSYFYCNSSEMEFEDSGFSFEMLKAVMEQNGDERLKGFRFFFSKLDANGASTDTVETPTSPLHCFVFQIDAVQNGNVEIFCPLFPRKKRETEVYYEHEIKELKERVQDLESEVDSLRVAPPPPISKEDVN